MSSNLTERVQDVTPRDTSVAWICALPVEMTVARAMLDATHDKISQSPMDDNVYLLGKVTCHKLIHLWRKIRGVPRPVGSTNASVKVQGVEVKPVPTLCYLGVQLDQHLIGMKQIEHAQVEATEMIAALCSIAGSTWGITLSHLSQMYTAVLWPQIIFASSTWFVRAGWGFKAAEDAAKKALESIQHKASTGLLAHSEQPLELL